MRAFPNEACVIHINHPVDPSYGKRKAVWQITPSDETINSAAIVELKFLPPKLNAKNFLKRFAPLGWKINAILPFAHLDLGNHLVGTHAPCPICFFVFVCSC